MMNSFFEMILGKAPWIVRWVFYGFITFLTALGTSFMWGWKAAPQADAYIDHRITTWAAPRIKERDFQFKNIDDKLGMIQRNQDLQQQDLRDIRNHIMSREGK